MQSPQAKLKEIRRILALWPSQAADDGEELVRAYLLAAEDYPADDVTAAVDTLVKGTAPGINPSFRPKPSEFGAECRRQLNLRVDREKLLKAAQPRLPPPDIEKSPEARARMKAKLDEFLAKSAAQLRTEDAEADRRQKAILDKTNDYFTPDLSDAEISRRLGFTVGDPDAEADAA